jgi:hypothetical protein
MATERFLSNATIEAAVVPVDLSSAANNGDWFSLENYQRVAIVLFKGAGTAGDDPVFTLRQATDASGTSAKALNFEVVYEKVGTLASVTAWTRVAQSAANTYTNTASAESQAIIVVEISARDLDVANGFTHLQLQIPDVGSNAQIGCGLYIGLDPRYAVSPALSALA